MIFFLRPNNSNQSTGCGCPFRIFVRDLQRERPEFWWDSKMLLRKSSRVLILVLPTPYSMTSNVARINDFRTSLGIIREERGFTQSQLSKYSGLDLQFIQEIENGTIDPELVVILAIANTLEIDVKDDLDSSD